MPTASVISPIMPPSASTSRTKCPFAMPPIAGLHDICAIKSTLSVNRAVFSPMRAAAIAASHPAWPAPTTTTSNCSVNACMGKVEAGSNLPSSLQFIVTIRHLPESALAGQRNGTSRDLSSYSAPWAIQNLKLERPSG